jgi:hypothetical protein
VLCSFTPKSADIINELQLKAATNTESDGYDDDEDTMLDNLENAVEGVTDLLESGVRAVKDIGRAIAGVSNGLAARMKSRRCPPMTTAWRSCCCHSPSPTPASPVSCHCCRRRVRR